MRRENEIDGHETNLASSIDAGTTSPNPCCNHPEFDINRRAFLAASGASLVLGPQLLLASPSPIATPSGRIFDSESLVGQLFGSLTEAQRKITCFSFDDPLRNKVDANWQITKASVNSFAPDQQDLIRQIFKSLHSEEYADKVWQQVEHDGAGADGFGGCSIALFGEPGVGKFEFVLSGRHVTRRCDGDSVDGAAFGGPIFYGHAAESFDESADHPGNVYWYQAKRAIELFQALNGKQRQIALLGDSRGEQGTNTVAIDANRKDFAGIPWKELSPDQQGLAHAVLADLLAPFRDADRRESMKRLETAGLENLHFAYYKNENIGDDEVWDVWQVEGPNCIWYFRGKPHVHAWVHIRDSK